MLLGSTSHITVYEVLRSDTLKELHYWNTKLGNAVQESFILLLEKIFGESVISEYKLKFPMDWLYLIYSLKNIKLFKHYKSIDETDFSIKIELPHNFWCFFSNKTTKDVSTEVHQKRDLGVSFHNGVLLLNKKALEFIFENIDLSLISHVENLLNHHKCKHLILVGDYAESSYLEKQLSEMCKKSDIIFLKPLMPKEAVLSAAVKCEMN